LRPPSDGRVAKFLRHFVKSVRRVLDAEEGHANERDAVLLLHGLCQRGHGARALNHVQARAVGTADLIHAAIAGQHGHDFHAHAREVVLDDPALAGHVEIAQQVDGQRPDRSMLPVPMSSSRARVAAL
jgi:hypothetical protein